MLRWIRAMFMIISGSFARRARGVEAKADYINSEYDAMERDLRSDLEAAVEAIASFASINREKQIRLESVSKQIDSLHVKIQGAKGKAVQRMAQLQEDGFSPEEIKTDPEIIRCRNYHANFVASLNEKEEEADQLEKEIAVSTETLQSQKASLERRHSELSKLREERHATIVDIKLAEQEERVANRLNGLALTDIEERRKRIQEMRNQRRLRADIATEMSGVQAKIAEEEFADFVDQELATDEFFGELGYCKLSQKTNEMCRIATGVIDGNDTHQR